MEQKRTRFGFLLRVACFTIIVMLSSTALNLIWIRKNPSISASLHEMQAQEDNIDGIILGPSVAWDDFAPSVFKETLGLNFFNLGANSQPILASNVLAEMALEKNKPKYIIYGAHWWFLVANEQEAKSSTVLQNIYDQMKLSPEKLRLFCDIADTPYIVRYVFPFTRGKNNNCGIMSLLQANLGLDSDNRGSIRPNGKTGYIGDGFVVRNTAIATGEFGNAFNPKLEPYRNGAFSAYAKQQLLGMKELCQRNGVTLVVIIPPVSRAHMAQMDNQTHIETLYRTMRKILGSDVPVIDYSYCREDYVYFEDSDFADYTHLNYQGAQKFSQVAAELFKRLLIQGESIDLNQYFYPDYAAMMANNGQIFNVWIELDAESDTASAYCTHGDLAEPEYEFSYAPLNQMPFTVVQAYSPQNTVTMSALPYRQGYLRVCVRPVGSDAAYQQQWTVELK